MIRWLKGLAKDRRGVSTVEYLVILGLVALAAFGAWQAFGGKVAEKAGEGTEKLDELNMGD